jgi:hypothetical protein
MALYPQAVLRLLPENATQRRIVPRLAILHTAVDSRAATSLYPYFSRSDVGAESHFFVKWDGTVEQYMDTEVMANANKQADAYAISIETEDDGAPEELAWSPEQLWAIVHLLDWCCRTHGIPRLSADQPDGAGISWHARWSFVDPINQVGVLASSPWTMYRGKTCPGKTRIRQFLDVVLPSVEGLGYALPEEDDDPMDLWLYINGCYDEAGRTPEEDRPGRRYWYKDFLSNSGDARVRRMELMEQLLGL